MRPKFLAIGLCLLLVALSVGFVGCAVECKCGEWGDITVSAEDWQETVECGGTIDAPSGAGTVEVSANYLCEPQECEATFEWAVSVPVAVIANGTCDTSPCAFEFELPDACAEVSVSAYCGDTLCDECTFTICPSEECACGEWGDITVSWGAWQETVVCGVPIYAPTVIDYVDVTANYLCEPQQECEATFEWEVSVTGAVIAAGTCDTSPGMFEFELPNECVMVHISAFCGGTLCGECTFTFCPYESPPPGGGNPPGQPVP